MEVSSVSGDVAGAGVRPMNLARDLRGIANLIELCFGDGLDRGDLAAVREMKTVAALGPLLWLVDAVGAAGMGLGFVWLEKGSVVGNVSTYRAGPGLVGGGPGWIVANVAVHPDHRRRGIAREMMEAALDDLTRRGAQWVVLQLEHDNDAARVLYEGLNFSHVGQVTQWHRRAVPQMLDEAGGTEPDRRVRSRRRGEWESELDMAARDRVSGLSWARSLEKSHFRKGFLGEVWDAFNGKRRARWVVDDGLHMLGSLWVDTVAFGTPRLTLLMDPSANQVDAGMALVRHGLSSLGDARHVRLEFSDRDPAFGEALSTLGFERRRTLTQMRWQPV